MRSDSPENEYASRMVKHLPAVSLALCIVSLLACLTTPLRAQFEDPFDARFESQTAGQAWPDIQDPGIDLGDFPNSAFTLPAGACQIEFAPFSILAEDEYSQPEYFTQFMFRIGLTDDVEFRILGDGFVDNYTEPQTTGFGPISLDTKIHLWDQKREWFLPASSFEAVLTTNWGTRSFSSGYQPSINMNFDFQLTETLNLEWTVGYGEVTGLLISRDSQGSSTLEENVNQISFQWAVEKDVTDDVQLFVTGATTESVAGQSAGTSLAFGGFWRCTDRLMYFGLMGWGVTPDAPKFGAQLGLGVALGRPQSE